MTHIKRRQFVKGMGAGMLGLGLLKGEGLAMGSATSEEPKIKKYNPLGKTGIKTSDIICGAGSLANPNVAKYAFDLGVNVFDTAESYMNGTSEKYIGKALKGIRDKAIIISKLNLGARALNPGVTQEQIIERANKCLSRLNTDRIDILFVHAVDDMKVVRHEAVQSAFEKLRKQGKVRFTGFSTHNAKVMLKDALDPKLKNFMQVILFMYNHMEGKEIEPLLSQLHQRGIGTIAMKVLAGGKHGALKSMVNKEVSYPEAAISWVMANSNVDCSVLSMKTYSHVEEYVAASGKLLKRKDLQALNLYHKTFNNTYCRVSCHTCESACPRSLPIGNILRYKMYYEDYGHEHKALTHYAQLPSSHKPTLCSTCTAPCNSACPHGLAVKDNLIKANEILS